VKNQAAPAKGVKRFEKQERGSSSISLILHPGVQKILITVVVGEENRLKGKT